MDRQTVTRSELTDALRAAAGDVSTARDELRAWAYDALGWQRGFDAPDAPPALAIVRPASAEEVAAIVRIANDRRTPIVPYGAGSGLMGGARGVVRSIVLDMRHMSRVLEIDAAHQSVRVEAGAVLADVDAELRAQGLMIGHDPWTFGIATVGGTISTNGLGFLGGKFGSMGEQVLGIEAVMADGTFVRVRAVRPQSAGIDLARLLIGGEGQFGVITAATLRAFPIPEARRRIGYTFESFERGFEALLAMQGIGLRPAMLDFGERPGAGGREAEPPTLYLGFDGFEQEVEAQLGRATGICESHGATPLDTIEVEEFWRMRHAPAESFARNRARRQALPASGGEARSFDYAHVALPASRVLEYRERAMALAAAHAVDVIETGLWVSPSLFSIVLTNVAPSREDALERMSAAVDACLRLAQEMGGSMEYCHGAGVRLAHLMADEHGAGLDIMRAIKRTLDPNGILNPGKLAL